MAYAQARKDFEYLETIVELDDTVACFMDNVVHLMENPNKQTAEDMYKSAIDLWFGERKYAPLKEEFITPKENRRIATIMKRYSVYIMQATIYQ